MAEKHLKLIVTGDAEKKSLHKSLQKIFPTHTSDGDLVVWDTPRKADGATGYQLSADAPPSASMNSLVNVMFTELLAGKTPGSAPPDLVVVIDDVELGNVGQENIIVEAFKVAVNAKLLDLESKHSAAHFKKIKSRAQACCAFHLLRPMVESYFFADPATLGVCGVPLMQGPSLVHQTDVECFDAMTDKNLKWQALYQDENSRKQINDAWWKTECHPKRYLTHLLSVNGAPEYQETVLGAKMIEATDWAAVAKLKTDAPIISSLLEDIGDWFGVAPTPGKFLGVSSPITYRVRNTPPNKRSLRNI